MSSKSNKTLNSSLGTTANSSTTQGMTVIRFTTDSTPAPAASGLLTGNSIYRFDTDQDCSVWIDPYHPGSNVIDKFNNPVLYGGVPEVFSTPAAVTGSVDDHTIQIVASGIVTSGSLRCTRMGTRGE